MTDFQITTSLQDNRPDDALESGKPYCSIVMAYVVKELEYQGWYNTGIVEWAATPEESFLLALTEYRKRFSK